MDGVLSELSDELASYCNLGRSGFRTILGVGPCFGIPSLAPFRAMNGVPLYISLRTCSNSVWIASN